MVVVPPVVVVPVPEVLPVEVVWPFFLPAPCAPSTSRSPSEVKSLLVLTSWIPPRSNFGRLSLHNREPSSGNVSRLPVVPEL